MKFKVLASGSKGNVTLLRVNDKVYLIDAGISYSRIKSLLSMYKVEKIDGIFITHRHGDHVRGLNVTAKRTKCPVYLSEGTYSELREKDFDPILVDCYEPFLLDDLEVTVIPVSHDVSEPVGFIFKHHDKKLVYVTDTGYFNMQNKALSQNADAYIFESNHNVEMLMKNPKYPWMLRKRIISDDGHLSNEQAADYLNDLIGDKTKVVVLAHLSEENNSPEVALETVASVICTDNLELVAASQERGTKAYEL
jgi:phosphoribosyl 1,2-cyclic phosphodiesterase